MKYLLFLPMFIIAFAGASLAEGVGLQKVWTLKKSKDGIHVYMRHTDHSRLKSYKATIEVYTNDPGSFVAVLNDYEGIPGWFHMVSKVEDLGRASETNRDVRIVSRLPWPVKDREILAKVVITQDPETKSLRADFLNNYDFLPVNDRFIRLPEYEGYVQMDFLGNNRVRLSIEAVGDMGGYIPAWLVNMLASDIPYFSLKRIVKFAQRPEYQGHTFDYIEIPEDWDK